MALALCCALIANIGYGLGTVLQATGARRAASSAHLDVMLFARLGRQLPYVGGLALDLVAFIASVVALRELPLFVVQSAIAGSIGVTAVAAMMVFGFRLRRSDTAAIALLILGLGLLGVSARAEHATHIGRLGGWLLLAGVVFVAITGAFVARLPGHRGGIALAACAGLGFSGTAIAARAVHVPSHLWRIVAEPGAIALVAYGACAMLMFATALQRGSVTATSAVMFGVETVIPSIVGLVTLGDRTRAHFEPVAIVGFLLAVGGSLALARYTEPARLVDSDPPPSDSTTVL